MVKEELCEKVVEVRSVSDRVMTVVLVVEVYAEVNLWVCSANWKIVFL